MAKEAKDIKPVVRRSADVERRRFSDFEKMFEDWIEDVWSRPVPRLWRPDFWKFRPSPLEVPALDVYEEKNDLVVKAEIPGLTKDEIDVRLEANTLTIKGEKKKEEEVKEDDYYRSERTFGAFSRTIELPMDVKTDGATASFKNGVLEIHLPKAEEAKKNVVKVNVA